MLLMKGTVSELGGDCKGLSDGTMVTVTACDKAPKSEAEACKSSWHLLYLSTSYGHTFGPAMSHPSCGGREKQLDLQIPTVYLGEMTSNICA